MSNNVTYSEELFYVLPEMLRFSDVEGGWPGREGVTKFNTSSLELNILKHAFALKRVALSFKVIWRLHKKLVT